MIAEVIFPGGIVAVTKWHGLPLLEDLMHCALDLEASLDGHQFALAARIVHNNTEIVTWTRTLVAMPCYSE